MDEKAGSVEVGDGTIAWRQLGSGEPLLLLNGYAATAVDWDPSFLEALAYGDKRLICPDNRGIGNSSGDLERLSVERMATDALAVLEAAGAERAPVVGWSMGGFIAQTLAAEAPERVASLTLLATDHGGEAAVRTEPEVWARLIDHGGHPHEQARRLCGLLFPEPVASEVYAEFGDPIAAAREALDPAALSAQESAMDAWHSEAADAVDARLGAIAAPTVCVAGAEDVVIPAANARLIAERIEGASSEVFPGCGHALMAQAPAELAALIRDHAGRSS